MAGASAAGPMLVLVLNVGSSSLKGAVMAASSGGPEALWRDQRPLPAGSSPSDALEAWRQGDLAPWWDAIDLVAHRVVHGGTRFSGPTAVTPQLLEELQALVPLAPLHNGAALEGLRWAMAALAPCPQWACFDTAFHAGLDRAAHTYALPEAWRAMGLRRFGFHGLSHQQMAEAATALWRQEGPDGHQQLQYPRLISCHLGAGCSLAAIQGGRSIDTTMGFTPLEGLVMAQRSGSIDPGLLLHLLEQGMAVDELARGLQQASGLQGLSGLSGDWRELRQQSAAGHGGAQLALEVFLHSLLKGIGAMAASLGGVDCITLGGGIGTHDDLLVAELQGRLAWLGPPRLVQVPTDEERILARLALAAAGAAA